jgi:hypothetical protein
MSSVILREIDKCRKLPRGKTDETAFDGWRLLSHSIYQGKNKITERRITLYSSGMKTKTRIMQQE